MDDTRVTEWAATAVRATTFLDAFPSAVVVSDIEGHILLWNRAAEETYGWSAEEVSGQLVSEVLVSPSDRSLAQSIRDRVSFGDIWEGDFTVLRRGSDPFRVHITSTPISGDSGETVALLSVAQDVSELRLLEQRTADLTNHLRLALDAGRLGTFRWDIASGMAELDVRMEALFGLEPGTFGGTYEHWVALLHPEDRHRVLQTINDALSTGEPYAVEHKVIWPDKSVHWLHSFGQVTWDETGNIAGAHGCSLDVTTEVLANEDRQRLLLEAVEAAKQERLSRERLEFLSNINNALATATTRRELMRNVARTAVPRLGDWCSIYVLPHRGSRIPEIEVAHADPAMVEYAQELQKRFPYNPEAPRGMGYIIRNGTPEFYQTLDEDVIRDLGVSEPEKEIVQNLQLWSSIGVPLMKGDQVLGGFQLVMTKSRRSYSSDDLSLIQSVASRIASGLESLRLSEDQRTISSTLQASLLPSELPPIPKMDVAVRYWASGDGIEVGGDFYDIFTISKDQWALVVGDVCGKGPEAAALTGLARHTLASAAWHGDNHEDTLQSLNQAMLARNTGTFCTVLYGTLQPASDGFDFTFACGGHPLPIVVDTEGSHFSPGAPGSLIGILNEVNVTTTTINLRPGDTLVLYTDGATDVPPPYGMSADEFSHLVAKSTIETSTVEQLADRLHSELSFILPIEERYDDIALLILRTPLAREES